MELVSYIIPTKLGETHTILPLGDIQYTGKNGSTAFRLLQEAIEYGQRHKAWYLGQGDYIDYASPSNRQRLEAAALYDTAKQVHDDTAIRLVDELYKDYLQPTTGRWLGMLEGHHWAKLESGGTSDQYLCGLTKTRFLGTCAYVGLTFVDRDNPNKRYGRVNIWTHHGTGSGPSAAAPVAKIENSVYAEWEADIYIIGHMTKIAAAPKNRVYPIWEGTAHLSHRKKLLVGSGGFSKAYEENSKQGTVPRGGYVEQGMMKPAVLGCPIIRITPFLERTYIGKKEWQKWLPKLTAEV